MRTTQQHHGLRRCALLLALCMFMSTAFRRQSFAAPIEVASGHAGANDITSECRNAPQHAEWLFCDDFEEDAPLVRPGRYFEHDAANGSFTLTPHIGLGGSHGMRAQWQRGQVGAGSLKLAFGRNPNAYMQRTALHPDMDFREIYYRMYLRMQAGWEGAPAKLSRVTVFTAPDAWAQAMIAHLWSGPDNRLLIDPARCVGADNRVRCATYNDAAALEWLGSRNGVTPIFDTAQADRWQCIEAHVRLNDSGKANGVQEFWINDVLQARSAELDFVRAYTDYGLNAVFFENHWNAGAVKAEARYFDNIVVATSRIGCVADAESVPDSPGPAGPPQ